MFGAMVLHDLAHEIGGEVSYEAQHEPADTVA
jgi:hypothetical protein